MADQSDRNEIFQGSQPGIPTRNVMQEDFSWEVPVEAVPVPSEGKVYPESSPLHLCKVVEIKAMTAHEEDILTSRALIKQGSVIQSLIRSCLINKNIDVNEKATESLYIFIQIAPLRDTLLQSQIRITLIRVEILSQIPLNHAEANTPGN